MSGACGLPSNATSSAREERARYGQGVCRSRVPSFAHCSILCLLWSWAAAEQLCRWVCLQVLRNSSTIRDSFISLADGQELAVQMLEGPDTMTNRDMLVSVRVWMPLRKRLVRSRELVLRKATTLEQLCAAIAAQFSIGSPPAAVSTKEQEQEQGQEKKEERKGGESKEGGGGGAWGDTPEEVEAAQKALEGSRGLHGVGVAVWTKFQGKLGLATVAGLRWNAASVRCCCVPYVRRDTRRRGWGDCLPGCMCSAVCFCPQRPCRLRCLRCLRCLFAARSVVSSQQSTHVTSRWWSPGRARRSRVRCVCGPCCPTPSIIAAAHAATSCRGGCSDSWLVPCVCARPCLALVHVGSQPRCVEGTVIGCSREPSRAFRWKREKVRFQSAWLCCWTGVVPCVCVRWHCIALVPPVCRMLTDACARCGACGAAVTQFREPGGIRIHTRFDKPKGTPTTTEGSHGSGNTADDGEAGTAGTAVKGATAAPPTQ